jgi:hypothetical protein
MKGECMSTIQATVYGIFISLFAAGFAAAQETAKKPAVAPSTARIAFDGGTLDAYVDAVRKQFANSNIVVDGGVGTVKLPKAPLARVTLRGALEWIPKTAEARKQGVALQPPQASREGDLVFVLTTLHSPAPRTTAATEPQMRGYNLSEEVRPGLKPDEVTKFLQSRLQDRRAEFKGPIKYDPGTRMLTVTGTSDDLRLSDHLIDEMARGKQVVAVLPRLQTDIKTLQDRVTKVEGQISEARKPSAK